VGGGGGDRGPSSAGPSSSIRRASACLVGRQRAGQAGVKGGDRVQLVAAGSWPRRLLAGSAASTRGRDRPRKETQGPRPGRPSLGNTLPLGSGSFGRIAGWRRARRRWRSAVGKGTGSVARHGRSDAAWAQARDERRERINWQASTGEGRHERRGAVASRQEACCCCCLLLLSFCSLLV